MKIAFTHNLRLTDSEEEAEFDSAETVEAIAHEPGSPGRVFKLDENSVVERLTAMEDLTRGKIVWSDTAGIKQVLRLKQISDPLPLLGRAYRSDSDKRRAA